MAISVRQLHKHFVGEVSGLDLRKQLTRDEAAEVQAAIDRYGVLVFHGQNIDDDQQLAFALNFGEREKSEFVELLFRKVLQPGNITHAKCGD